MGHKGYGLGVVVELLGGALSGAGCARGRKARIGNGCFLLVIDIGRFQPFAEYAAQVRAFADYLRSSPKAEGVDAILLPGELEKQERAAAAGRRDGRGRNLAANPRLRSPGRSRPTERLAQGAPFNENIRSLHPRLGARGRGISLRHPGRGKPRPARITARLRTDPIDSQPPRTGRGFHGRYVRPPHRQDRRLPSDPRAGGDQLRHLRRLRPTRRHAHADDHRPKAHQVEQAGAIPDRRYRRNDAASDQVHPPDRQRRQRALPRPRGVPLSRGGAARGRAFGTARRHRLRRDRYAALSQGPRAATHPGRKRPSPKPPP